MKFYDYYKLLNIPLGSSAQEVIAAYDIVLNDWHAKPTKKSSLDELEVALNQAMFILTDPLRKEVYDRTLLKLYVDLSQEREYKKYGMSRRNKWLQTLQMPERVGEIREQSIPKSAILKRNIYLNALLCGLVVLAYTFLYWVPIKGGILLTLVFLAFVYAVGMVKTSESVHAYYSVRQRVAPCMPVGRAVAYTVASLVVIIPVLWYSAIHALPIILIDNESPVAVIDEMDVQSTWTTAHFRAGNKTIKMSFGYSDKMNHDFFRYGEYKGKLYVQYWPHFPKIAVIKEAFEIENR